MAEVAAFLANKELADVTDEDVKEIEDLRMMAIDPVSLNLSVGDEDGSELGELIADDKASQPEEVAMDDVAAGALTRALERLSLKERQVIRLRHGLGGEPPRTLEEVAAKMGQTRERVRIIENETLAKLAEDPELAQVNVLMSEV